MEPVELQIANLRKDLTKHLQQVCSGDTRFIIKKRQKPFAALVPYRQDILSIQNTIECSLCQVRSELADLVNQVFYNNMQIVIKKHKDFVAVIRPLSGERELLRRAI